MLTLIHNILHLLYGMFDGITFCLRALQDIGVFMVVLTFVFGVIGVMGWLRRGRD